MSGPRAEAAMLRSHFGEDPDLIVSQLTDAGHIPPDFPVAEQAVISSDGGRLASDPSLIDR